MLPDGKEHPLAQRFVRALRSLVEPVVSDAGLQWLGLSGIVDERDELTALFEADDSEFVRKVPHLWPEYPVDQSGCIDLWIRFHVSGRRISADLEADEVVTWLQEHGHTALAKALREPAELEAAVGNLAKGLRVMLAADSTQA